MIADRRREAMNATTVRQRRSAALAAAMAAALLAACDKPAAPPATMPVPPAATAAAASSASHGEGGIAWREAANDAEVDAAFAAARAEHKPVFVYWGAKWCPPCNQVQATLFNRRDFIER
jgi:thiol:disulfide interchange protein